MIYRVLELLVVGAMWLYQLASPKVRRARSKHVKNLQAIGEVVYLSHMVRQQAQFVAKINARAERCGSDAAEEAEAGAAYSEASRLMSESQRIFDELKGGVALRLAPGYELPQGV